MTTFAYTSGDPSHLTAAANASMADIQGPLVDIRTFLNGNITDINLSSSAAISEAKLATGSSGLAKGVVAAYLNANQTGVVTSTFTKVAFNAEDFDVSGWFDTAAARYTPQVAGYYRITAKVRFLINPTTNTSCRLHLYKNGAAIADLADQQMVVADEDRFGSKIVQANGSTDFFEIFAWHNAGANKSLYGDNLASRVSYFEAEMIGRS